jgi:hypothetical protein
MNGITYSIRIMTKRTMTKFIRSGAKNAAWISETFSRTSNTGNLSMTNILQPRLKIDWKLTRPEILQNSVKFRKSLRYFKNWFQQFLCPILTPIRQ